MPPAIRVENLGKRYRLNRAGAPNGYRTLRESLVNAARSPFLRRKGDSPAAVAQDFWALDGVAFEIQPGEVVGIIGRNGAGKSTLLKVLSRITRPSRGRVEINGRVGSLLEVGTGFHPELTGRENVFLNGSILGMKRTEIAAKFEEIVAFAEVEKFLDLPVKRYSSGMYVRLAFAVAAHLEPEVLLVDEVLAVGDASYQERCIDRMGSLAASGQTILLVSHNMDIIPRLCHRAILMDGGKVEQDGPADTVVERHLASQIGQRSSNQLTDEQRPGDGSIRFAEVRLLRSDGRPCFAHVSGDDLIVETVLHSEREIAEAELAVSIKTVSGTVIVSSWTRELDWATSIRTGRQAFTCRFKDLKLRPGHTFQVVLWAGSFGIMSDLVETALTFSVLAGPSTRKMSTDKYQGAILGESSWSRHDGD